MDTDYYLYAGTAIFSLITSLILLGILAFFAVCMWRIFVKAGKPGWAALVPIYSIIVELEIVGRPWWLIFLMFIPYANMVVAIILMLSLAKVFGKSTGFAIGLIFLSIVFIPILAFDDSKYLGPEPMPEQIDSTGSQQ